MSISFRGAIGDLSDNTKPKRSIHRMRFLSFPFLSPMMHSRAEIPFETVICGSPTGGGKVGDTTERDENSLRVDGSTFHPKTFNPAKSHYSHSVPSRIVLEAMFDVRPIVVAL